MRKNFLIIMIVFLFTNCRAQNQINYITISSQYMLEDTTRTFGFLNSIDFDESRKKLIDALGTPRINEAGLLSWDNINLPKLGNNLKIILSDGVFTKESSQSNFMTFKDNEHKSVTLNELKKNQTRDIEIVIQNNLGKNVVNQMDETEWVKDWLNKIIEK